MALLREPHRAKTKCKAWGQAKNHLEYRPGTTSFG
jgi:hypothetical protein